ncbi:MAG: helix-turn-helix domain-containing protein [Chloroflexi bacterium]|jgi:transposase|nr:helix-turn-helix domain-containing protein [Chloroflexota bacterium]
MRLIRLAGRARRTLQHLVRSSTDGPQVRRAQVLLWVDAQVSIQEVAKRIGYTRQAIYAILQRYRDRQHQPVAERLRNQPRAGRPATKRERTRAVIQTLLVQPPARYHYRSPVWTVPMLRTQVQRRLKCSVSARTVRRALHELRNRFKRPRYIFAQRPPTWRQVKGGSKQA